MRSATSWALLGGAPDRVDHHRDVAAQDGIVDRPLPARGDGSIQVSDGELEEDHTERVDVALDGVRQSAQALGRRIDSRTGKSLRVVG
jgi:hypothetical protein